MPDRSTEQHNPFHCERTGGDHLFLRDKSYPCTAATLVCTACCTLLHVLPGGQKWFRRALWLEPVGGAQ